MRSDSSTTADATSTRTLSRRRTTVVRSGGYYVLRLRRLGLSGRIDARSVSVSTVLLGLTFVVFIWSISVGPFAIPFSDVFKTIAGDGPKQYDFVVNKLRLPRSLTAVLVGSAFGLSGAIFQRVARNPLASPDIIGINAGATTTAVFVIIVLERTGSIVTVTALAGSLVTAILIYLLAYRKGITGYRLVLVGIGVTAMLNALTSWLLTRAEVYQAQRAMVWFTGSLNNRTWDHVRPVALALLVLGPIVLALARTLRMLDLGDDTAVGLGTRINVGRSLLLLCGVLLAAVGTASAGPVAFVALVAPQIARRLVGPRSMSLVPAALVGALLLLASDLIARQVLPTELPVGVVTGMLGAPYLIYLLVRANRIGSGG